MISKLSEAVAAAGLVTRFYQLLAGLVSLTVLLAPLGSFSRPLDAINGAAVALGITDLTIVADIDRQAHAGFVAAAAWLIGLAALLWSLIWLHNEWQLWDKVRGSATAWVCFAALMQVGFFPWSFNPNTIAIVAATIVLLIFTLALAAYSQGGTFWRAMEALGGTVLTVPLLPLVVLLAAIGGSDSAERRKSAGGDAHALAARATTAPLSSAPVHSLRRRRRVAAPRGPGT